MIFAFVGMPLAGKSTLIKEIQKEIDLPMISTGDSARKLGMKKEKSIKSHDLSIDLNDAIVEEVLAFINKHEHCIIDGFPRSEEQIKLSLMYDFKIIFVQANPLDIYERALNRNRDKNDQQDIVAGRCEAALILKKHLYQYYSDFAIFSSDENFVEYKNDLVKSIKELIE